MKSSMIPKRIERQISEVAQYAGSCDDWVTIKKEIMKGCPSHLRSLFSTRDPITKEQRTSSFDRAVIKSYERVSGTCLVIRSLAERRELNV